MKSDPERHHPVPERPDRPFRATEPMDIEPEPEEIEAPPIAEPHQMGPTWEPIDDTTPRDGRDIAVRWGEDDTEGRIVRWKDGRYFNGRRWLAGGRWVPSDGLLPLTMDPPTLWMKPPRYDEAAETEDETAAA